MLLLFEDPAARDIIMNKRVIEMLTNVCFSALNHAEGLMSVKQSIKSKTSKVISSENKAVKCWIVLQTDPRHLMCK